MISFALTQEQEIVQATAAEFAREIAGPAARAADEAAAFPEPLLERSWGLGLVQAAAGGEMGEQPGVTNALALQQIARGDAALAVALAAPLGFVRAIAELGSNEQQQEWLAGFSRAPRFAAIAHTDAGWFAGVGRGARVRRQGSQWRLTGAKALVPLAARCAYFLATAESDEGPQAFVVDASTPGVRVAASHGALGMRALQMADVVFDDVLLRDECRLPGAWRRVVDSSRVALAATLAGLAHAVYDYAVPYAKARVVHGEAIARKQAIAFKLADMHVAAQAMTWMSLRAAWELDAGCDATRNARLAQRYANEHGLRIADEGVQVFGGHGFVRDLPLEMWLRNARTLSALDGLVGV